MPKRITKGTGMKKKGFIRYDIHTEAAEHSAHLRRFSEQLPRATWAEIQADPAASFAARRRLNAEECQEILRSAGIDPHEDRTMALRNYSDSSPEWLAHLWLNEFKRVESLRSRLIQAGADALTIEHLLDCAEQLGRVREDMYWRCEADPETGSAREKLAIKRRDQLNAFKTTEARDQWREAMRPRMEAAARWAATAQALAEEYFTRHPDGKKTAAAKFVMKQWPKDWPEDQFKPSESTIRQTIVKT